MSDSAQNVYNDFLKYLTKNFPNYDVAALLTKLQIFCVIDGNDAAIIAQAVGPAEKARVLFQDRMPSKDTRFHQELIDVFRSNGTTSLAEFLETRLAKVAQNRSGTTGAASGIRKDGGAIRQELHLVETEERRGVYSDFCKLLDSAFPVEKIAVELERIDAITYEDLESIRNEKNTAGRISVLFKRVMVAIQDKESHKSLIDVLEKQKHTNDANFLRRNLFR